MPLLPTVCAADGKRGPTLNSPAHAGGEDLCSNGANKHPDKRKAGGDGPTLAEAEERWDRADGSGAT